MATPAFSTGVSIQYPQAQPATSFFHHHPKNQVEYPFCFPTDVPLASERPYRSDTDVYSVYQELAYVFVCDKVRHAMEELLRANNETRYCQIRSFFERYCARSESGTSPGTISTLPSPLRRRVLRNDHAPVLFPAFHAFPTAAIIAGTDATSSDLWVGPLLQKLQRTFPLCVVVPRDMTTARRFIEWLAARLAKVCTLKRKEEQWIEEVVDHFDLLPLDMPPVAFGNIDRRVTRQGQAKEAGIADGMVYDEDKRETNEQTDDSCYESSAASEDGGDDTEFGSSRRGKRKRRRTPVAYGRWTMSKLLLTIKRDIDELVSSTWGNTCRECVAMLGELVHDRLLEALNRLKQLLQEKEEELVSRSIACFDEAVAWLQCKIRMARDTAAKLLNAAPSSNNPTTSHVGITEMALALVLQRVFRQYVSFLDECTIDRIIVNNQRRTVKQKLLRHENYYSLQSDGGSQITTPPQTSCTSQPFLLLCIEQLEAFSQQVFGDFLEIWTHFVRQQQDIYHASETSGTLGFVIGVASATSPALRRLDLAVTNRLELQFFSLVDSRKCFNDILESLVVKARLPLTFSGEVLRAIASRHLRVPSVPRLLLALRFLLFTHFRRCPWSFLALAVDDLPSSDESPILVAADVAPLPHRVSVWIKRHRQKLTREVQGGPAGSGSALTLWLASCSAYELRDLKSRVVPSSAGAMAADDSWIIVLEAALLKKRRRQACWRMGWECFRSTCSWLDVRIDGSNNEAKCDEQEDLAVTHLALALEGRLGEAPRFMEILQRLQNCKWALLSGMIEDWRASFRVFGMYEDDGEDLETVLCELAMLCAYARTETTPAKMEAALRKELVAVFTDRLVSALLHPPLHRSASPPDALVTNWTLLTHVNVLKERLCFEYHENLCKVLQEAGIGDECNTGNDDTVGQALWVHDVGLAFLFYQESAGGSLSLCEWYESFAMELQEEEVKSAAPKSQGKTKKKKTMDIDDNDAAIKSRFVRAICTLRHWGFIKSDAPRDSEQDFIEKLVFI